MTPRNPLDKKVIVDRTLAKAVLDILDANCASFSAHEREELRHALAADLTGWAATLVNPDRKMLSKCVQGHDLIQTAVVERNHRRMLEASPPLPTGEKQ